MKGRPEVERGRAAAPHPGRSPRTWPPPAIPSGALSLCVDCGRAIGVAVTTVQVRR